MRFVGWAVLIAMISGCATPRQMVFLNHSDASSSPEELTVQEGSTVRVTLSSGEVVTSWVSRISDDEIELGGPGNEVHEPDVIPVSGISMIEIVEIPEREGQSPAEMLGLLAGGFFLAYMVAGLYEFVGMFPYTGSE